MNIKMIVTDLDATLLRSDRTISKYTADVFRRVHECGVFTAFATARDYRFITEHISPLFGIIPDVIIADNGALARYNNKDLYKRLIPSKTANALLPRFELISSASTEDSYYLHDANASDHWSIGKKNTIITDFVRGMSSDAFYLAGTIIKPSARITEEFPEIRTVAYSDVDFVTLVHCEATKLNALTAVERALNIIADEIAAFGDDYSDIEMLRKCGVGVVVANAIDEVKSAADYVCDSNDNDGVAKWIEENVLI